MNKENVAKELRDRIDIALLNENVDSLNQFVQWFEDWFIENEVFMASLEDGDMFQAIQNLYSDIGFYEPLESLRSDNPAYFDANGLGKRLRDCIVLL